MHIFLDDSGDGGLKFDRGSSRHLIMAACVFEDPLEIEKAATAIKACREKLHRTSHWEFKYAKTSDDTKTAFFAAIRPLQFHVRAIVIDKQLLYSHQLRSAPKYLQNYAIKELLTHTLGTVKDAKLVIDGNDTKAFRLKDAAYFRKAINQECPGTIAKVSCEDSKRNALVQLADMVAGAVHRDQRDDRGSAAEHMRVILPKTRFPKGSLWLFR